MKGTDPCVLMTRKKTMSYLPSSKLYDREPEPEPQPVAAAPKVAPIERPAIAVSAPAVVSVAAPKPAPPAPRPATQLPKEWLVSSAPALRVEVPAPKTVVDVPVHEPPVVVITHTHHVPRPPVEERVIIEETVTSPAPAPLPPIGEPPARKRNIFHKAHKVVLRHLDRAKNKAPDPSEPDLLWFAVMVVGSVSMGLMIWGAYSALPRFGNLQVPLRADASSSRLKVTNDVPVRWVHESGPIHPQHPHVPPQPPPHVETHPMLPVHTTPISVPPPPPPHDARPALPDFLEHQAPPPIEPPLAPLPERKDPAIFVHANLGETPMIRTWKKLAESSVLLTAFAMASAHHALADVPNQIDNSKQIEELTKAVKSLSDKVDNMKIDEKLNVVKSELNEKITKIKVEAPKVDNTTEFELLNAKLVQLERLVNQLVKNGIAAAPNPGLPVVANGNLDEIKAKLGNIEQAILRLQPTEKRIALSPPDAPAAAPAVKANMSLVVFVNLYNQDLWLWVNQKQHRVPSNSTLTLDSIAAGPATIEVRSPEGIFHRSNPTLVANETFTLTAR